MWFLCNSLYLLDDTLRVIISSFASRLCLMNSMNSVRPVLAKPIIQAPIVWTITTLRGYFPVSQNKQTTSIKYMVALAQTHTELYSFCWRLPSPLSVIARHLRRKRLVARSENTPSWTGRRRPVPRQVAEGRVPVVIRGCRVCLTVSRSSIGPYWCGTLETSPPCKACFVVPLTSTRSCHPGALSPTCSLCFNMLLPCSRCGVPAT
jgi:hypothetical protein